jgi:hypothetical protein
MVFVAAQTPTHLTDAITRTRNTYAFAVEWEALTAALQHRYYYEISKFAGTDFFWSSIGVHLSMLTMFYGIVRLRHLWWYCLSSSVVVLSAFVVCGGIFRLHLWCPSSSSVVVETSSTFTCTQAFTR